MSGIIFLLIIAVWLYAAIRIARFCTGKMQLVSKRRTLYVMLFILVFIAPVVDEIIGGFQFRALCSPEHLLVYEPEKLMGKSVVPRDVPLQTVNKIIPIVVTTGQWEDLETGEILITRKILRAKGGWLSRLIGFPQGSPPYTFKGICSSSEYYQLFKKYNVTKVEN